MAISGPTEHAVSESASRRKADIFARPCGCPVLAKRRHYDAGGWGPSTWAMVAGVDGTERNIKYNRLDDCSRPDYAELEER